MKQLIQVLRETKTKKIRGNFFEFKYVDDNGIKLEKTECTGKCAMGVLCTENDKKDIDVNNFFAYSNHKDVMMAYGIDNGCKYPSLFNPIFELKLTWNDKYSMSLAEIIMYLNDVYELEFKQIADFLEVTFEDDLK